MYNGEQLYAIRRKDSNSYLSGHHYYIGVKLYRLGDARRVVNKHNTRRVYVLEEKTLKIVKEDNYEIVPVSLTFGEPV